VAPLDFKVIETILKQEYGENLHEIFSSIHPEPLGSASIAQVHRAQLNSGESVVIKVQRPGIVKTIEDDLNVLYFIAELVEKYIPEMELINPVGIIDEYFKTLQLETNFVVEANNIRRFRENFAQESQLKIPEVYFEYTSERVLVMEAIDGSPLSQDQNHWRSRSDPDEVIRTALRVYMKMVFKDGLFHGDLHAGNVIVLPQNKVGLIDFGVVGRLNEKTKTAIASMLVALAQEDYERLAYEYADIAPFTDRVDVEVFARELRQLIAPFYGLTLKNVNLGKILMSSSSIAGKHRLQLPTELMLFFKSIVNIESVARRINHDFDFLAYSLELAKEIVQTQYDPKKVLHEVSVLSRDAKKFVSELPRQLHFLIRKMSSANHQFRFELVGLEELRTSIERNFNLLFLGIVIASLVLSSSIILVFSKEQGFYGIPWLSFFGFLGAGLMGIVAFFNYIRRS
jgi:ubiquinone biosynthesis protein